MKKWIVLAVITCLMAILMACGSNASLNTPQAKGPDPVIEVADADIAVGELEIIATDWDFDKDIYAIRAGEPINLTVNSIDGNHGIEIWYTDYTNVRHQKTTEVTINEPGTYTITCSIPCGQGHRTMTAKLVVVG